MKVLLLTAILTVSTATITAQTSAHTPAIDPNQSLVLQLSIPAPVHEVWQAFTTADGLATWLFPKVSVNLRPGGDWLVEFPGSTGGGTILSFVPDKEIIINALAPDKFPIVRAARTHAKFTFTSDGLNTIVRLTQTGWQRGSEWDAAYEYLAAGNAQLLAMLHHRFVAGPTDWAKAMAK